MDLPTGDFDSLEPCCFAGEVLPVDDLLDLDIGGLIDEEESDAPTLARKDFLPSSSSSSSSSLSSEDAVEDVGRPSNCFRESPSVASCSFGQGHEALYHPPDELAELDWLSSFVDDSYTMEDKSIMPLLSMSYGELEEEEQNRAAANKGMVVDGSPFARSGAAAAVVAVAKAARSKRARSGGRVWAMQMQALRKGEAAQKKKKRRRKQKHVKQEEEDGGSGSMSESSSCVDFGADEQQGEAGKRKGRKRKAAGEEAPRRCSHCQVQKTPQWRAGPCGPKSLCNACGVRYKSGRLLPEYRPAASPTFLTTFHSNSHKKVLEMRRLKLEEPACETPLQRLCVP